MTVEVLDPPDRVPGMEFRTNSWAQSRWMSSTTPELLMSGHLGSGKTRPLCEKADARARLHPRARVAVCRRYRVDLGLTTLKKFLDECVNPAHKAWGWRPSAEGGSTMFYRNGSEIVFAGLDNPGKVMSAEFDMILFDEATEVDEFTWNTLSGRLRWRPGRDAAGNPAYAQLGGVCNPSGRHHHLFKGFRPDLGSHVTYTAAAVKLAGSRSVPAGMPMREVILSGLNDNAENLDDLYLARLQRYKGKFRDRFVLGVWADFEGSLYTEVWDPDRCCPARPPEWDRWGGYPDPAWPRFRSFDFGFKNPFVCQWWARDGDGTYWRYREVYQSRRTVPDHKAAIVEMEARELAAVRKACEERNAGVPEDEQAQVPERLSYSLSVADHDAGERAILEQSPHRILTRPARKDVETGVQTVYDLLAEGRLRFVRGALVEQDQSLLAEDKPTCTEEEMPLLHYPKPQDTVLAKRQREGPVKEDDHGHDATMYLFDTIKHMPRPGIAR